MQDFFRGIQNRLKTQAFYMVKSKKANIAPKIFEIDKAVIENQAKILVQLEFQHFAKLKGLRLIKRSEKLNKCRLFFLRFFRKWLFKWKELLKATENLKVSYI